MKKLLLFVLMLCMSGKTVTAQNPVKTVGKWMIFETVNPMTDQKTVSAGLSATEMLATNFTPKYPVFAMSCTDGNFVAGVNTNTVVNTIHPAIIRFDSLKAEKRYIGTAPRGSIALVTPTSWDDTKFIKSLRSAALFRLSFQEYEGNNHIITFALDGVEEVMEYFSEQSTCRKLFRK